MPRSKYAVVPILIILLITGTGIVLLPRLIVSGLHHVEPASLAAAAGEDWKNGDWIGAALKYGTAAGMAIEGGLRSMIAQPYVEQFALLEKQGNLRGALDNCIKAVRILGSYDDEGSLDYFCMTLDFQIQHPSPPLPPNETPTSPTRP